MKILGISAYFHDSSASLIIDGQIVAAAAEERFTRIKHDNSFPENAINFCLDYAGLAVNEIDYVCFYEKPVLKFERVLSQHLQEYPFSAKTFIDSMGSWFNQKLRIREVLKSQIKYYGEVLFVPHHLSHASSGYYLSGFNESVIVTLDGVGEWSTTTYGKALNGIINIEKEIHFPHSLGLLYSAFTSFLGYKVNSAEYKVMGLAAYGNPQKFIKKMDKVVKVSRDGSFAMNMKYFDYTKSDRMFGNSLENLFGYHKRIPETPIEDHYADIAASLQLKVEQTVFNLLNVLYKKYGCENLCMSGGVALNSVLNGKIIKNTPFKNIFIPPDPGDGGGAMGAALYINNKFGSRNKKLHFSPYLGPDYPWYRIKKVLEKHGLKYNFFTNDKLFLGKVSDYLDKNQVVGWFQGRMEWGPRALGARSILANAKDITMKNILNEKVKKREMFRPFAPVILKEYAGKYFYTANQPESLAKFMLLVLPFKNYGKKKAAATVHIDGTGRLQTIEKKDNSMFYNLLKTHHKKTGEPVLINTSFNVRGEPIVCTPDQAVECFLGTGIDVLVIDRYIIEK